MAKQTLPAAAKVAPPDVESPPQPRWHCHLKCPTPLSFNPLVTEADSEHEAKAKFFAANGISGSVHEFQVRPAADGE